MNYSLNLYVSVGDHIIYHTSQGGRIINAEDGKIGKILMVNNDTVEVAVFERITSALLMQYSLPPIQTSMHPLASLSSMAEVVLIGELQVVRRVDIEDVAFILLLSASRS
jgi:hypothetical protein